MSSHCLLIILSLIFPLPSAYSCKEFSLVKTVRRNHLWQVEVDSNVIVDDDNSFQGTENGLVDKPRSWKGRDQGGSHRRHPLRTSVPWILNVIGWGTLLPIGVITARFFRKVPLKCQEWYNVHVLCQTSGYIIGAVGWGVSIWLGNSRNHNKTSTTYQILGTIIFTFATIQMCALWLQPKEEDHRYRRYWEMYHQILGYALIAMIVADIFQGINGSAHLQKLRWLYLGLLGVLVFIAIALQIFTCIRRRHRQQMPIHANSHTFIIYI